MPVDVKGQQIEVIKEQILDLNDKFDFLISLMIQSNKLKMRAVNDEHDEFKEGSAHFNLPNQEPLSTEGDEITDPIKGAQYF